MRKEKLSIADAIIKLNREKDIDTIIENSDKQDLEIDDKTH